MEGFEGMEVVPEMEDAVDFERVPVVDEAVDVIISDRE